MLLLSPFFGVLWNATDVALIMGATGTLLTVLVGLWIKIQEVHKLVNSVAENLKARAKELADAEVAIARMEGEKAGIAKERDTPMVAAKPILTKEVEMTGKAAKSKRKPKPPP